MSDNHDMSMMDEQQLGSSCKVAYTLSGAGLWGQDRRTTLTVINAY